MKHNNNIPLFEEIQGRFIVTTLKLNHVFAGQILHGEKKRIKVLKKISIIVFILFCMSSGKKKSKTRTDYSLCCSCHGLCAASLNGVLVNSSAGNWQSREKTVLERFGSQAHSFVNGT